MTNYEHIINLSLENLADLMYQSKEYGCEIINNTPYYVECSCDCKQCILEYLKKEINEDDS